MNYARCMLRLLGPLGLVLVLTSAAQAEDMASAPGALDCIVEPSATVDLGAPTPGVLAYIPRDRADFIEAGEVVAELESDVERATLKLAEARANLTTTVELRRANAAFGERQEARHRELVARKLVPRQDYERFETEAKIAQLQAREANDDRRLAYLEFKRAEAALARRVIRSPIAGVVVDRFKSEGEYVEDQPVLRVANIDTLHVEILAPVTLLGRVQVGMQARVKFEPAQLGERIATVTRVDAVADAASGTFGVRLELDNPDRKLPAGLRCVAQFDAITAAAIAGTEASEADTPALAGP